MNLQKAVELFTPYANTILGDETGAEVEKANDQIISQIASDDADWIYENWDIILKKLEKR